MAVYQTQTETFDWLSDLKPAHLAAASWDNGDYLKPTVMHVVYKPEGPFAIACGAGLLAAHVRNFRFTPERIKRLGQTTDAQGRSVFRESFLNFLQRLRLRLDILAAAEGTVLLPEEPLLIVKGPLAHIQLLESAFRLLVWNSTHWATLAAAARWDAGNLREEETPPLPPVGHFPDAWRARAQFIGGAPAQRLQEGGAWGALPDTPPDATLILNHPGGAPLVQIRRVYRDSIALGDIWLTAEQESEASVSRSEASFGNKRDGQTHTLRFTRFRNLYQPIVVKGTPVVSNQQLGYLRQRTLQYLTALKNIGPEAYPYGWMQ